MKQKNVLPQDFSEQLIQRGINHLKNGKANGTDNVLARLLRTAGDSIVPSLMSVFTMGSITATLPQEWKCHTIAYERNV